MEKRRVWDRSLAVAARFAAAMVLVGNFGYLARRQGVQEFSRVMAIE